MASLMNYTEDGESHMNKSSSPIRIGKINFTNVWPIFHHFDAGALGERIELVSQVPTELNAGMAAGRIDMGPISSFAYAESFEKYVLFPELSVSALGRVNSILLFHKKPLSDLQNGRIMLPTTSATSVNLLKIIMAKFFHADPEYILASPSLEDMMTDADAALLIGDDAIKANWGNTEYEVTDLGQLWESLTGEWMSFAVWAIREETVDRHPELVEKVFRAFQQSKQKGLLYPDGMIQDAQNKIGGPYTYWHDYFSQLCYDFGEKQQKGLQTYYQLALELGLLQKQVPFKIWTNNTVV
jgi:chorismate dehydratase